MITSSMDCTPALKLSV